MQGQPPEISATRSWFLWFLPLARHEVASNRPENQNTSYGRPEDSSVVHSSVVGVVYDIKIGARACVDIAWHLSVGVPPMVDDHTTLTEVLDVAWEDITSIHVCGGLLVMDG
jgi:hypothetical protein